MVYFTDSMDSDIRVPPSSYRVSISLLVSLRIRNLSFGIGVRQSLVAFGIGDISVSSLVALWICDLPFLVGFGVGDSIFHCAMLSRTFDAMNQ